MKTLKFYNVVISWQICFSWKQQILSTIFLDECLYKAKTWVKKLWDVDVDNMLN